MNLQKTIRWTLAAAALTAGSAMAELNYGDYSSSTLTGKAWDAMHAGQLADSLGYIAKCKEMYLAKALEQQATLKEFAPKEKAFDYWALNDVGTCYYIEAQVLEKQGKKAEQIQILQKLSKELSFCQCYDAQGWFWHPAESATTELKQLEFDAALEEDTAPEKTTPAPAPTPAPAKPETTPAPAPSATTPTPEALDFGDYSSSHLTGKAWDTMNAGNYTAAAAYIAECKKLYEKTAIEQQATLKEFAPKEKAFDYWALNDVGTCYYIECQMLEKQGKKDELIASLKKLSTSFKYCQCWDEKGWFWHPAETAGSKLRQLEFDAALDAE
ncbi:MAG: hypothetical protein JXR25_03380 [Pontiellaceae bacterium]|nr:hypothetical protein [Pontiellaceae bacterium]MBN2783845.1 hypothetical protein [Pontiellaceae bacterium]